MLNWACTSFRGGARILESLLHVSPANSLRTRTHTVALVHGVTGLLIVGFRPGPPVLHGRFGHPAIQLAA